MDPAGEPDEGGRRGRSGSSPGSTMNGRIVAP
jgi:hypothetical protein